ncbi:FAD-containing oxidoreductase [Tabrizicola sp.]|uniref:FAD-containing oxidoreductase n=1 Tax=Tabrizicola sp. TaxID=2005166 RepID=UPI003F357946
MGEFDAIVIGAGQAGPALAARLAGNGQKVALIERKHMGGTCVNNGCMPTKTMVASAYAVFMAREGARFGAEIERLSVNMTQVKARKDEVVMAARSSVTAWMEKTEGVTLIRGHARFTSPNEVEIDGRRIRGERIFINVGARAVLPPVPGLGSIEVLTNSNIMDLTEVPSHLVVIGGSYIALEFAQIYRRFGAKVTVIERAPQIIFREDADVIAGVRAILEGEGVEIHSGVLDLEVIGATPARLRFTTATGEVTEVTASHVLAATGRRPNTDDLGLEAAGLVADPRGVIPVDETCRTVQPHIWVLGEANGRGAFTHTTYNDYEIVADNLLNKADRRVSDRIPCYALFVDPPLGRIGMSENEARAAGHEVAVGRRDMRRVGRANESGETRGFMKVVLDTRTRKLLGASVLGFRGDEAVQSLLVAMYADMTADQILRVVGIHPTVAELLPFAIADAGLPQSHV